jgi:DNA mismatch endonuclease (patch repair protein)
VLGLGYRLDDATLPGRPDIVFRRARVAVFCDGDFWHGRDAEQRFARLAAGHNADYWLRKIARNVERDRRNDRLLEAAGWLVLRVWEGDIVADPNVQARRIADAVRARRGAPLTKLAGSRRDCLSPSPGAVRGGLPARENDAGHRGSAPAAEPARASAAAGAEAVSAEDDPEAAC